MIKIKTTIVLSTLMLLTSCKSKGQICDTKNYKELNLTPVNSILKIPPYDITDTIRYGDLNNIFKREVHSLDSSIVIFAGIKSYVKDSSAMPDILHRCSAREQ